MGFASTYIENRILFPCFINEAPHPDTRIIVVVPAFNEPAITILTDSLALCHEPDCAVEVLIVLNAPDSAEQESLKVNNTCKERLEKWRIERNPFFRLYVIDTASTGTAGWGVGLARKTGMDEAIRRFDAIGNPDGVILCLDADCRVDTGYFSAVRQELLLRKDRSACSIYFEHPVSGNEFGEHVYRSIISYELHLRYYYQALAYTGFPWVHHTVGSAIAVKSQAYVKAGGMNRRQAGEDFYFIQKLVPAGGYFNLNQTIVYPSPRESFRVPFGTGTTISKLGTPGTEGLLTYDPGAFRTLKIFFDRIDEYHAVYPGHAGEIYNTLPEPVRLLIGEEEWNSKIDEVRSNTGSPDSFKKRFFTWFNMFRIVKYLNCVHGTVFEKRPVYEAALELLELAGSEFKGTGEAELLNHYRKMERPV